MAREAAGYKIVLITIEVGSRGMVCSVDFDIFKASSNAPQGMTNLCLEVICNYPLRIIQDMCLQEFHHWIFHVSLCPSYIYTSPCTYFYVMFFVCMYVPYFLEYMPGRYFFQDIMDPPLKRGRRINGAGVYFLLTGLGARYFNYYFNYYYGEPRIFR